MKNAITVLLAATAFMSANAFADDPGLTLAKQKECFSCHALDKGGLAPTFLDLAKKYKGKTNFDGALITQIISGTPETGGYHWGTMKMPSPGARTPVSVVEANKILDWILSLK